MAPCLNSDTCGLRGEHHQVLSATGLNSRLHAKAWSQSTQTIDQPITSGDRIGLSRASTHCFAAAFSGQPLGAGDDHSGVGDKQVLGPRHDGSNGALLGIASSVSEALGTENRCRTFVFAFISAGHAVNARTAFVVDRHVRVDCFIAQPASPALGFPKIVKPTHLASSLRPFSCRYLSFSRPRRFVPMPPTTQQGNPQGTAASHRPDPGMTAGCRSSHKSA